MTNVQNTLSEMAKDLYDVGAIDKTTLRQFDIHSLPPLHHNNSKLLNECPDAIR